MNRDWNAYAHSHLNRSIETKLRVQENCLPSLLHAIDLTVSTYEHGGKLLICGNGGSAADAQHLAAEFISTLSQDFPRAALPAIALTTDSSTLTARANDYGFDEVFSRQVEAFGQPGDTLLAISTSGGSQNCIRALETATERGLNTIALVGGNGGRMAEIAQCTICVPSTQTMHVQESHLALYHIYCYVIERRLNPEMAAAELAAIPS